MSPEQAAGEDVDWRSDLWSLGVVAREMLTGRPVFEGTNVLAVMHAVMTTTPEPIRAARPDVTSELEEIIARTMARDRNARTITAGDVRDAGGLLPRAAVVRRGARRSARLLSQGRVWIARRCRRSSSLAAAVAWLAQRNAKVRWAREQALPEIIRLAGTDKFDDAFRLAQEARRYIPDDPLLTEQIRAVARPATIDSEPSGAEVFYRPYGRPEEAWRPLGGRPSRRPASLGDSSTGRPK